MSYPDPNFVMSTAPPYGANDELVGNVVLPPANQVASPFAFGSSSGQTGTYTGSSTPSGKAVSAGIYHWNNPVTDSVLASATIPPGSFLVGDLHSQDNVKATEIAIRFQVVPTTPPAPVYPRFFMFESAALADIDGTNYVNPEIAGYGSPGGRTCLGGDPENAAVPGIIYYGRFLVQGTDFAGFRICVWNGSVNQSLVVTASTRTAVTNTA